MLGIWEDIFILGEKMNEIILSLFLLVCAWTDIHDRKIYNAVIFPGIVIALILNAYYSGWSGLTQCVLGLFAGLGLLMIPFILGGMGAGDVKLLSLVGAFKGPEFVFYAFLLSAVIGGIMAIFLLIYNKSLLAVGKNIFYSMLAMLFSKFRLRTYEPQSQVKLPYGVAIAVGTLIAFWVR